MDNLWSFLLHTLNMSIVAGLLLFLKRLLRDKLSPRWQYAVWALLALRAVIPSATDRYILLPLPLWLETAKGILEETMHSVYCSVYEPIRVLLPVPTITKLPASITDWLFLIYTAGIFVALLRYLTAYIRLRRLLPHVIPLTPSRVQQVKRVCDAYNLKSCKLISIPGLSAPFVCGVVRPVLVFPDNAEIYDNVILHELLHLKYRDPLQTIGWTLLRSIHWCNPFLQYVFDRIGNDMEALCDQRVLAHLEGEDRRSYGMMLLQMSNEKYARSPGTSSISNGGRNIARRIEAIVRFKKYPRGMSLVSICILITLIGPTLLGSATIHDMEAFHPVKAAELKEAMAYVRINRCTTLAGALDTYAKGLMTENGIYIAAASPLSSHAALEDEMHRNCTTDDWVAYHLDSGWELDYVIPQDGYAIFNLEKLEEPCYRAVLGFGVSAFLNENGIGWRADEDGETISGSILVPVRILKQEDHWVVEETDHRIISYEKLDQQQYLEGALAPSRVLTAEGNSGTVTVENVMVLVNDHSIHASGFFSHQTFDVTPKLDAQFQYCNIWDFVTYTIDSERCSGFPAEQVGLQVQILQNPDELHEFESFPLRGTSGQSSNDGSSSQSERIEDDWDGTICCGSGSWYDDNPFDLEEVLNYPEAYAVRIIWDLQPVEDLVLKEAIP